MPWSIQGAYFSPKSKESLSKVEKLLDAFPVLPIDRDTYESFAALSAELKSQGRSTGDFDELIAAITMTNGAAIVSRDHHFQHIPGLKDISH